MTLKLLFPFLTEYMLSMRTYSCSFEEWSLGELSLLFRIMLSLSNIPRDNREEVFLSDIAEKYVELKFLLKLLF